MKDYTVLQFKKGDFQDNHGNYWCDMALEGVSEPVRIVVKDPTKYSDGMELYGEVKEQTSKAGKTYLRFFRASKEGNNQPGGGKPGYSRDDSAIRAQWAIGQAVQLHIAVTANGGEETQGIEATAKELFAMVNRVKDSDVKEVVVAANTFSDGTPIPDQIAEVPEEPISLADIPF